MQWTSIIVIHILTMFVYYVISDHTDGTVIQHAISNVDACTHFAYLFLQSYGNMQIMYTFQAETTIT